MADERNMNAIVGERIREYRKFLGYSQEYVAEALNISDREYRRIERGEVVIYVSTIAKLVKLGFDEHYLFLGRVAIDVYLDKAYATMPKELFEDNLSRMESFFSRLDPNEPNYSLITKEELEEMDKILLELVKYGHDHFEEAIIPEEDECNVFTDHFKRMIPERIKRKEKTRRINKPFVTAQGG